MRGHSGFAALELSSLLVSHAFNALLKGRCNFKTCALLHMFYPPLQPRVIKETSTGAPTVPGLQAAFVSMCWPELKLQRQPVELKLCVDGEDSTPAAAGETMLMQPG
jgi:hypothetical protein